MKMQRLQSLLVLLNLGILALVLIKSRPVEANNTPDVLRAHKLEIVDAEGKVRATIQIVPAGPANANAPAHPEAVLLRLIRPDGRPSVKIETTERGSGLDLGGGIDPSYIVLAVKGGDPSLSLINKDGRQQLVKP
jgi:hypothetical protein